MVFAPRPCSVERPVAIQPCAFPVWRRSVSATCWPHQQTEFDAVRCWNSTVHWWGIRHQPSLPAGDTSVERFRHCSFNVRSTGTLRPTNIWAWNSHVSDGLHGENGTHWSLSQDKNNGSITEYKQLNITDQDTFTVKMFKWDLFWCGLFVNGCCCCLFHAADWPCYLVWNYREIVSTIVVQYKLWISNRKS